MKRIAMLLLLLLSLVLGCFRGAGGRMAWWQDARFGLFLHWGLYAIPAGEWQGETFHGEWIRSTAKIPLKTYDTFLDQFNPTEFDADAWVLAAKQAGMKYIVLTTKHHDGFCLFDSEYTEFDVMATPFKRDIVREIAEACHRHEMKVGWYYSIMDWHHPDYLPRRSWETDRPTAGADYDRYFKYMLHQIKELLTHYGPIDILWFDGEWEPTWNAEYGKKMYAWARKLQPEIIINNRVGGGRNGMAGFDLDGKYAGDFFTPEQTVPDRVPEGQAWESCITMNGHWGWNKADKDWKKAEKMLYLLSEITAKGGNLLLNVGPMADGTFPDAASKRLRIMGKWMDYYGEAIYGTTASPFKKMSWGRCTQKRMGQLTRLYLHIWNWPKSGQLELPGLYNQVDKAFYLAEPDWQIAVKRKGANLRLHLPKAAYDPICSVVALDIWGTPDVDEPPEIVSNFDYFIDDIKVALKSDRRNVEIRYALDGSNPTVASQRYERPLKLHETTMVTARCFRNKEPVSGTIRRNFRKIKPLPARPKMKVKSGLHYKLYKGEWKTLPKFSKLNPVSSGTMHEIDFKKWRKSEYFGVEYWGYIKVPKTGVYGFRLASDDGSQFYLGSYLVVDNNGAHSMKSAGGIAALEKGLHPFKVLYFNQTGKGGLQLQWRGPGFDFQELTSRHFYHQ